MNRQETTEKVLTIFREAFGERAEQLKGSRIAQAAMNAIEVALTKTQTCCIEKAAELAFHLCDWNSDAAFLVALFLFPEHFTEEEIESEVRQLLVHVPEHMRIASEVSDHGLFVRV